jgi:hypothetical protein
MTEQTRWVFSRLRGVHRTRLKTISAVLWGFLSTTRLGVTAIANGISSLTSIRHSIKRVSRFLCNPNVDPTEAMRALCREAEALGKPMVVALDWVELRGGMRALVAGLCTGKGRALPLAWTVVKPSEFYRSQNNVEEGFLRLFSTFFVDPARVCIIADRGFRRAAFLALLDSLGFGYVVRICGHVHVKGARYAGLLEEYRLAERGEFDLGRVSYREDGVTRTRVVARWMRGSEEPWYLATNLDRKLGKVCDVYAMRMEIEEGFRDLKSHRYGAALRYVRLSEPERYERLFMIWAMGTWLLWAQGLAGIKRNLHLGLSSAPNTRRDLSILRIGAKLLKKALGGPPGLIRAMAA